MTKQNKPAPLVDGELPHLLDDDGNPLPGNEPKSQVQDDLTTAILRIIDKADEVSRSTTGLADEKYIAHREELIRGFTEFHNNHLQAAVRIAENYCIELSDRKCPRCKNTMTLVRSVAGPVTKTCEYCEVSVPASANQGEK